MKVIEADGLTKIFRTFRRGEGLKAAIRSLWSREVIDNSAVVDFSCSVNQGEIVGLLGPNGAGKTTLVKMLCGIVVPSRGQAQVLGYRPADRHQEFRRRIALVMGQKSQLWWDVSAMDSFSLLQKYYDVPLATFRERVGELAHLFDVERLMGIQVRRLSLGERMKMELMACLLHKPDVLFLDEPTIGLDIIAQKNVRDFLLRYHQKHRCTIILTSHYMADVEALCRRIVLVLGGKKRFDGSIQDFNNLLGREKFVSFQFREGVDRTWHGWAQHDAQWSQDGLKVDVRVGEEKLRAFTAEILDRFPVTEFGTEKLAVERVMHSLLMNPQLLGVSP